MDNMTTNNEYLNLFLEISSAGTEGIKKIRESLSNKFPHSFDIESNYSDNPLLSQFVFREKLVKIYAWAVTDSAAIKEIVKTSKDMGIIEIGAGTGYWASLLANCGVDVKAYDTGKDINIGFYHPVGNAGVKVVEKHKNRALFLCWPPYNTSMAYDCVTEYSGNTLIYIGESEMGCNANGDFFKYVDNNFKLDKIVDMAQWYSLHDNLYIYKR